MMTSEIGAFVAEVHSWDPRRQGPGTINYVDLSSVDQQAKEIVEPTIIRASDAPSRARQLVSTGDVLVSTVRPNLNAVAQVPPALDGATASTGFCVLRPQAEQLDGRYLFHWVRTREFIGAMVQRATGASYPAVTDRIVKSSPIPLPSIEEQRRIAAVLDSADALRAKRRQALTKLDFLTQATFIDMFISAGWDAWEARSIEDLAASTKGAIRTGPFGSQLLHEEFTDDGIAVLGIDNAVQNKFAWGALRYITEEKYSQLKRFTVFPGDVLVTIMGTCGRTAIVPDDIPTAINTKHLCCITLDKDQCLPEWLWACLRFHPGVLRQLGSTHGAVMPGLNMHKIKRAEIPAPPIALQSRFAERKARAEEQIATAENSADRLDTLFSSLQQRAFRGEL